MGSSNSEQENNSLSSCTISRDIQNFDLLIEDMEAAMGDNWGALNFAEALAFFNQPESEDLEFVAVAIDESDENDLSILGEIIIAAKSRKVKVILIAEDVSPTSLHQLLRQGADEFVPYPLPENELQAAIDRLRRQDTEVQILQQGAAFDASAPTNDSVVLAVQGIAGGTGATTFAVNLAWELANVSKDDSPSVCLLDLSLQTGTVATYLDLPRRDIVYELWSDTEAMDDVIFKQTLVAHDEKLWVLTAPPDILPLDMIAPEDVNRVVEMARRHFDYVIIDMPGSLVLWTETVLHAAQIYFTTLELDMRSAQNALRLKRALKAEELPIEKLRFCLNRAPRFTDLNGKSRVKRMAESLEISVEVQLPDGGRAIMQAGDHGTPLATTAAKNPLRREIAKLASSLHELSKDDTEEAA